MRAIAVNQPVSNMFALAATSRMWQRCQTSCLRMTGVVRKHVLFSNALKDGSETRKNLTSLQQIQRLVAQKPVQFMNAARDGWQTRPKMTLLVLVMRFAVTKLAQCILAEKNVPRDPTRWTWVLTLAGSTWICAASPSFAQRWGNSRKPPNTAMVIPWMTVKNITTFCKRKLPMQLTWPWKSLPIASMILNMAFAGWRTTWQQPDALQCNETNGTSGCFRKKGLCRVMPLYFLRMAVAAAEEWFLCILSFRTIFTQTRILHFEPGHCR